MFDCKPRAAATVTSRSMASVSSPMATWPWEAATAAVACGHATSRAWPARPETVVFSPEPTNSVNNHEEPFWGNGGKTH